MTHVGTINRPSYEDAFDSGDGLTTVDGQIMDIGHVPVSDYTSQKRFEQERAIFRRVWLNVAREEELPQPGDWIVREIACLSASILICRERTGQQIGRASCRERGCQYG